MAALPPSGFLDGADASAIRPIPVPVATETWPEFLRRIADGQTQAQIAERIGIGRLSVSNWLRGNTRPKAETVIAVARVYRCSPIEALLAAAYLTTDEVDPKIEIRVSLADLPAGVLAGEVHRRLAQSESERATGSGG